MTEQVFLFGKVLEIDEALKNGIKLRMYMMEVGKQVQLMVKSTFDVANNIYEWLEIGNGVVDKLLQDIITDDVYKIKKTQLDTTIQELEKELAGVQTEEELKRIMTDRIDIIREKLEGGYVEKAAVSEMVENIEVIQVFPKYLEIKFSLNKLLGVNQDALPLSEKAEERISDTMVIHYPLPEDFVYQDRKRLERERIVEYMKVNPHITAKEIAKMENVSLSGINYRIKRLKKDGRIYYQGRGGRNQTGQWIVCEDGEEK